MNAKILSVPKSFANLLKLKKKKKEVWGRDHPPEPSAGNEESRELLPPDAAAGRKSEAWTPSAARSDEDTALPDVT